MFSQIDALAFRGATFGVGSGPIFLDQVNCIGSEANILQCDMSSPIGAHMCDHTQDAGIRCEGRNYINIICVILKLYQGNLMVPLMYVCLHYYHGWTLYSGAVGEWRISGKLQPSKSTMYYIL